MSEKNLVLELNAKMLFANQIAGLLNFNINNFYRYKVDFLRGGRCLLKL